MIASPPSKPNGVCSTPQKGNEVPVISIVSPRKAGERLAVFIPCKTNVWLLATCDAASPQDADGNIEFTLVEESSVDSMAKKTRLLNVDIRSLPLHNINISRTGVEDMCDLGFLHEASILDNLQRRFKSALPYTRSGEICIAVNPYRWLDIYSEASMENYARKLRHEIAPHVFATSAEAYRGLRNQGINQSILVSGESGAGKTETVKIMLNMIAHVATPASKDLDVGGKNASATIVQKIISANPLLESFGNAKTARNDNSSRFGKFTELQFDKSSSAFLIGSKCTTYLLEKSRVVTQNDHHERNYHIFYQLLAYLDRNPRERIKLRPRDFKYLQNGDLKTTSIEGKSDMQRYNMTMDALALLGVSNPLRLMMENILLGILHLGEMEFEKKGEEQIEVLHRGDSVDSERLEDLFGLTEDSSAFEAQITSRSIDVEGKFILVPLTLEQASTGKDALSKEIYARLFQWLVVVINFTTSSNSTGVDSRSPREEEHDDMSSGFGDSVHFQQQGAPCGTIALLDIFGFESFKVNRFEQFCINYANEKLQQKFCLDCFRTVQQEYRDEGLEWETIPYNDNIDTLCMLEGSRSVRDSNIIAILNEECLLGARGSDEAFLSKIKTVLGGSKTVAGNKAFSWNVKSGDSFTVHHYAGRVEYSVALFVEKNRDTCPLEIHSVLARCKNPLLATLFGPNGNYFVGSSVHNLLGQLDKQAAAQVLLLHDDTFPVSATDGLKMRPAAALQPRMLHGGGGGGGRVSHRRQSFINAETVTSKFKTQLGALLMTLSVTQCQYVRCIKPNVNKSSSEYSLPMVVSQLRSAGMIEAIRISRAAFPYRITHDEFLTRFGALRLRKWLLRQGTGMRDQAGALLIDILRQDPLPAEARIFVPGRYSSSSSASLGANSAQTSAVGTSLWEVGRTKLYFTAGVLEHLETLRSNLVHETICRVQALYRGMVARRHFLSLLRVTVLIQARRRGIVALRHYKLMHRSIIYVQACARGWIVRRLFSTMRIESAATKLVATYRMSVLRRMFLKKLLPACRLIQSMIRMQSAKRKVFVIRDSARQDADICIRLASQEEKNAKLLEENSKMAAILEKENIKTAKENSKMAAIIEENIRLREENAILRNSLSSQEARRLAIFGVDVSVGSENNFHMVDAYTNASPRAQMTNSCTSVSPRAQSHVREAAQEVDPKTPKYNKREGGVWTDVETPSAQHRSSHEKLNLMHQEIVNKPPVASSKHDQIEVTESKLDPSIQIANDSKKESSPAPRIHKQDVKELLRLMEAGTGLSCTVYAVQKKGGSVVGKPAVIKKCSDGSYDGGARIDVEVRTPSPSSTNGYTGITGSTPKKNIDLISLHHPAAAPTIKVLRFGVADVLQVRRGRCGLVQLPKSVSGGMCLVVTVRNKGELNFVLDSKVRCEVAYVAFHYMMQRCGATPIKRSPSPVRSPISSITPSRASRLDGSTKGNLQISTDFSAGVRSFRSPLAERAQQSATEASKHAEAASYSGTVRHAMPPAPPTLPFGTVLTSPYSGTGSRMEKENQRSPAPSNTDHHSKPKMSSKKEKDTLEFTDTGLRDAIANADELLAEEPVVKRTPSIAKRGWVTRDSAATGLSTPHWQRKYLMLERETRLLKFSQSELAEHYPSQVRSLVALNPSTTTVKVSKSGSTGFGSYFSSGVSVLEISSGKMGEESTVKLQFENMDDLSAWQKAIEDVLAGVR